MERLRQSALMIWAQFLLPEMRFGCESLRVGFEYDPGIFQMGPCPYYGSKMTPFFTQNGRGFGTFRVFLVLSLR